MPTKRVSKPPVQTIGHGKWFNEDTDDSDFPSDQESGSSGSSSDLESIASGDNKVITEARAAKKEKEAREAKAHDAKKARKAKEVRETRAREAMQTRAAKEREARPADEQEARVAAQEEVCPADGEEEDAGDGEEQDPCDDEERDPGEENEARQDVSLTDEQVTVLNRRVAEFRLADPDTRTTILENAVSELERSWTHDVDFDRELLETLARRYLYNRCRRELKTPNFRRNWTYKDIVTDIHRKEVDKMAAELSGSKAGSVAYLACWAKALKTIEEGLDEETRVKYRAEAKQWSEHKPPPRQQQRMFQKYGMNTLWEFSEMMYRQYGVRVAVLAGYCDAEGESAIMLYDNNHKLGGTSFKDRNKQWPKDPLVEDFSRWTAESFAVQPSDSGQESGKKTAVAANIKLQTDGRGYPVLPSWEEINREGRSYKKALIGKFLSDLYHIAAGGSKGRIPWARLQEAQGDFILPKYLPNGCTLTQYHHIRVEDADALLKHWTQRQAAGEIPFRFKNNPMPDRRGKRALTDDNIPAPTDQLEGDRQGTGSHQEQGSNGEHQGDGEDVTGNHPRRQHNRGTSSRSGVQGGETGEELRTQGDGGGDAPHPPNPPHQGLHPRPHNLSSNPMADQAAGPSTNHTPCASAPISRSLQEHPHNDETAADEAQGSPRKRKKNTTAAVAHPSKRQNIQPEPRRSTRPPQPADWVKEAQ